MCDDDEDDNDDDDDDGDKSIPAADHRRHQ